MLNITIYSNCQGIGIKYFLKKSNYILKNYKIHHIRMDNFIRKKKTIKLKFKNYIKNADILIYQPLNEKHKEFSTKNILKLIKPTCKTISFPYIYNNSFYPIKGPTEINQSHFGKHCHIIFDNSECITNLIDKKLNLDEILKLNQENKINFNYEKRYNNTINILENKEKVCDVKIVDFIKKNFTKERLFLLENHPTSIIFISCWVLHYFNRSIIYPIRQNNPAKMPLLIALLAFLFNIVKVDFFDKKQLHVAILNSKKAEVDQKSNDMKAIGEVIAVSDSGITLYTDTLFWNAKNEKMSTVDSVMITTLENDTIYGVGFESDSDLQNWKILKPSGVTDRVIK